MLAITIGIGPKHEADAEAAADTVRWSTGLETVVLTETPGELVPARYKLRLLDLFPGETILYFDADTRFVRRWCLDEFADEERFVAVQDYPSGARDADCADYAIDPYRYANTGLWIANARHAAALALADTICHAPDYHTRFRYEQTALNAALQRLAIPMLWLDRRYNAICDPHRYRRGEFPANPVVIHRAGAGCGANAKLFSRLVAEHASTTR